MDEIIRLLEKLHDLLMDEEYPDEISLDEDFEDSDDLI